MCVLGLARNSVRLHICVFNFPVQNRMRQGVCSVCSSMLTLRNMHECMEHYLYATWRAELCGLWCRREGGHPFDGLKIGPRGA